MTIKSAKKTSSTKDSLKDPLKDSQKGHSKNSHKAEPSSGSREDRVDHRIPIQMLVDYRSGGNYLFDFCRDMGTGGVFIETPKPLPMGAELELTFTIPDSKETLRTKAKVIWSQQPVADRANVNVGMGVQFENFSIQNRKILTDFISRYGAQKGEGISKRRAG
ncbi:MAG: TIGR02266 family protein [Proteobacteria bacterium]|nr:TIGR02266 family protein [Pseudomonadota bacterium]